MSDPDDLLDKAKAGLATGKVYDIEFPNGLKIHTNGTDAEHQRVRETIADLTQAGAFSSAPPIAPTHPKAGLLSERIEKFLAQMKGQERSETNHFDTAFTLKVFLGLVGDKDLSEVSPTDMDTFMDALAHWPANASKKPQYKGLTPKQVVAKAKGNSDKKLAPRTKEKHLDRLRVFLKNCMDRRLIAYNPCDGLRVTGKAQDEEQTKQPFNEKDLKALFDPSHITPIMPHKHWIPILGLYTGARLNELAQLHVEDIECIDGVFGMHIRRKVKNPSSRRFVPLRQELLDLGFIDYIESAKQAKFEHVFPGLPQDGNGPGDPVGDWFNRTNLRKTCGINDPSKSFHSFRHTFASLAERSGLSDQRIARLTGHSSGSSVLRRHYIQASTLQERFEDIGKIRFPELSIKALKKGFFEPYFKRLRAVEARKERVI
ncbi:Tyrosine recombinase XerC [Dyella sp. AD56]|nr:Tyrosine recombinase XerC [Dyella sp. AD56]